MVKSILIIGGGLAGLAAAVRLAPHGYAITILESRNRLGGRASSFQDSVTGQLIDACQHVSMGCCTAFTEFCEEVGNAHLLEPQKKLWFMTPDRRISEFSADPLPAPFHLTRTFLRMHYLTWFEKLRIVRGLLAMKSASAEDDPPLLEWLKRHGQNANTIERFWKVVLVSALNESVENLGLKYARKVFVDAFLTDRHGFEVQVPKVPLKAFYGAELQQFLDRYGVKVRTDVGVKSIIERDGRVEKILLRDGSEMVADLYLSAVPAERLPDLLPPAIADRPEFAGLSKFRFSPITSVHLWLDRTVLNLPHLVLIECVSQWIFVREGTPQYLQVVISASEALRSYGHEEIERRVIVELRQLLPEMLSAKVLRSRVITERTATFIPVPDVDRIRPSQVTSIDNFFLAGDWTVTGWPATMEGAVRSGFLAADAVRSRE